MPEHIPGTNFWNLFAGEQFTANDGRVVKGPIAGIRIEEFPEIHTLSVQGVEQHYEVPGDTVEDFGKIVTSVPEEKV